MELERTIGMIRISDASSISVGSVVVVEVVRKTKKTIEYTSSKFDHDRKDIFTVKLSFLPDVVIVIVTMIILLVYVGFIPMASKIFYLEWLRRQSTKKRGL